MIRLAICPRRRDDPLARAEMQHTDVVAERDYTPLHSLDEAVELSAVDVALQHALGGGSKSVVQCAHLAHELCGVLLRYRRPLNRGGCVGYNEKGLAYNERGPGYNGHLFR